MFPVKPIGKTPDMATEIAKDIPVFPVRLLSFVRVLLVVPPPLAFWGRNVHLDLKKLWLFLPITSSMSQEFVKSHKVLICCSL